MKQYVVEKGEELEDEDLKNSSAYQDVPDRRGVGEVGKEAKEFERLHKKIVNKQGANEHEKL